MYAIVPKTSRIHVDGWTGAAPRSLVMKNVENSVTGSDADCESPSYTLCRYAFTTLSCKGHTQQLLTWSFSPPALHCKHANHLVKATQLRDKQQYRRLFACHWLICRASVILSMTVSCSIDTVSSAPVSSCHRARWQTLCHPRQCLPCSQRTGADLALLALLPLGPWLCPQQTGML